MKKSVVVLNLVLFAFVCFVLVTDGAPEPGVRMFFLIWQLMTLLLSAAVISFWGERGRGPLAVLALICNFFLFGFVCWNLIDQHDHPLEVGAIVMAVMMVVTPVLNSVVLFRTGPNSRLRGFRLKGREQHES